MGSIEPYVTSTGQTLFRARYRKPDKSSTSKRGFKTKRDAQRFLNAELTAIDRGQFIDASGAKTRFEPLAEQWLLNKESINKPSAFRSLESTWRVHVKPKWGQKQIGEIRHSDIQKWVASLSETRSASTVLRAHGIIHGVLNVAVRDNLIPKNAADEISLPRKKPKRRSYLSMEQVELLANACGNRASLVFGLAYTGLRWGEITGLRLRDFDPEKKRFTVNENAVDVGGKIEVGTPKTHKTRPVPVPDFLCEIIEQETSGRKGDQIIFGNGTDYVRLPSSGRGWFIQAVRRCQEKDLSFPMLSPHDLRHTAASLAISVGANVKAVQRMLGHASAAVTLDIYADLFDDDLDSVAFGLNQARSERIVSTDVSTEAET